MGFVGKGVGSATAINGTCAQNSWWVRDVSWLMFLPTVKQYWKFPSAANFYMIWRCRLCFVFFCFSFCSAVPVWVPRHLRTSEMSQRKFGIATILPVTDSFVSVAFVRCLVVLRIDSVASKESNTCLVRGLSQVANFRGTCFRFLICKSPNLRSWPATYFSRWFLLPQRRIKA